MFAALLTVLACSRSTEPQEVQQMPIDLLNCLNTSVPAEHANAAMIYATYGKTTPDTTPFFANGIVHPHRWTDTLQGPIGLVIFPNFFGLPQTGRCFESVDSAAMALYRQQYVPMGWVFRP